MKIVTVGLLVWLCIVGASAADRPKRGEMKGMELYSWSESGKWIFVLLSGTNRLKSEDDVKARSPRIESVPALRSRFMQMAEGEIIVWNLHFVPGFSFPEEKMFSEVMAAAKDAGVELRPDR
jgi:hypothetical protein